MTSAIAFQPTTTATCEERTEELVRKIKGLSFSSSNSKTNGSPESPSASFSKDPKSHPPVRSATPPSDEHSSPPGMEIVYSAKVHPRSPSPPPKSLARTFPCPPEIPFPNETKITSNFVRNTRASGNCADGIFVVKETKHMLTDDAALPPELDTNILQHFEGRMRSRARRGRGNLWTPPRAAAPTRILTHPSAPLPQTRPEEPTTNQDGWDTSNIVVKLSQISLSVLDEPIKPKHEYYGSIPAWLESLPDEYESAFRLDSALNHRVSYANHPRLEDQFTTPAFTRFSDKIKKFVRNEVEWEGLREKWD
jgi:hypothetical protein